MAVGKYFKDLAVTNDADNLLGAAEKSDGSAPGYQVTYSKDAVLTTPSDAKIPTQGALANRTRITVTPTITVGGIIAGTTYTNVDINNFLTTMTVVYQNPSFTSFAISGQSTKEVGDKITGIQTFTWAISNIGNVQANSVNIYDITGSLTLITGHSVTSPATYDFNTLPGGGVSLVAPGTYTWRIQATNTNLVNFTRDFSLNWYWLLHYGTSTNASLNETQIKALVGSLLTNTTARTYSYAAGGYKYLCVNEDLPQPTSFKDAATNLDVPFEDPVTVNVTNTFSIASNYKVYRSTNILGAAINIIVA